MASVKVIRPPLGSDPAEHVPRDQWPLLVEDRRRFCSDVMPADCRMLLFFIEDAAKADWLGFTSRENYLTEGLGLDLEMVTWAIDGLKLSDPGRAIGINEAVVLGQRNRELDERDRENRSRQGQRTDRADFVDKQDNNIHEVSRPSGTSAAAAIRRLRKDRPDIHGRVLSGEMTAHAGMVEAGFRKRPERKKFSPFEQVVKLLPKLTAEEWERVKSTGDSLRPVEAAE